MISMRPGETLSQYIDRVGILEKQSMSAGENFQELDRIRTISRGPPDTYWTTKDLIRELKKSGRESIAMIIAREV